MFEKWLEKVAGLVPLDQSVKIFVQSLSSLREVVIPYCLSPVLSTSNSLGKKLYVFLLSPVYWVVAGLCGLVVSIRDVSISYPSKLLDSLLLAVRWVVAGLCGLVVSIWDVSISYLSTKLSDFLLQILLAIRWVVDCLHGLRVSIWDVAIISYLSKRRRNQDRQQQESDQRKRVDEVAERFVDLSGGHFSQLQPLADLGSRMQKIWFRVTVRDGDEEEDKIMTLAPVSSNCPLKLERSTIKTLNKFLSTVKQHPLLHAVDEVHYLQESSRLVMIQPLIRAGSLKDLIYNVSPVSDWSRKYSRCSKESLDQELVASYGRQILEAVTYLYQLGLSPLGHIHTGNIFIEGEICRLGGYENRLFGYRARLYNLCRTFNCSEDIDVVMFGYVIFEMACGYELTRLVPGDHDYRSVKEQVIKELLQVIFARTTEGQFIYSIQKILALEFFQEACLPSLEGEWSQLSRDVQTLVSKVLKGKPQKQLTAPPRKKRSCVTQ